MLNLKLNFQSGFLHINAKTKVKFFRYQIFSTRIIEANVQHSTEYALKEPKRELIKKILLDLDTQK